MINQKRLLLSNRLQKSLRVKSSRKRLVRYSLITANVVVLGAVVAFVIGSSRSDQLSAASALADNTATSNPVDGLTSYDIAANVARMASLPESTAINNQAQSARVAVAVSTSDNTVIAKPQIVATALKSRNDIKTYIVAAGDTVTSIAQKFGVTSNSIRWSNNLSSDTVALGSKLNIPPVNGIIYTVKSGDTIQTLATKFSANTDQLVAYNDAEIAGIHAGEQILIPNGQIQAVTRSSAFGFLGGSFTPIYGSNGYDPGWCTYYAAAIAHVPSNWGNASTWAYFARLSGWTVSTTPVVGAVAQTSRGNHVGIVDQVSADGSQIIYSDMNGLRGFNRVGTSGWVSAANGFDGGRYSDVVYIYR